MVCVKKNGHVAAHPRAGTLQPDRHVAAGDNEVVKTLTHLARRFADHGASHEEALARATVTLASLVRREANVLSTIDGFAVPFWAAVAGILMISLMHAAPAGPLSRKLPTP